MKRLLSMLAAFLLIGSNGVAQDFPQIEVFGGYSYFHADDDDLEEADATYGEFDNLHGWNASVAGNVNRWLGLTADFSGHYVSDTIEGIDLDASQHNFLFGPRVSFRREMITPFAHALFGASRLEASAEVDDAEVSFDDTAFSMALGGGVDVNLSDRIAIRAIQIDWLHTRFDPAEFANPGGDNTQNNARLSFGVVFKFGSVW
jgi:opacity protein-like surface antigen